MPLSKGRSRRRTTSDPMTRENVGTERNGDLRLLFVVQGESRQYLTKERDESGLLVSYVSVIDDVGEEAIGGMDFWRSRGHRRCHRQQRPAKDVNQVGPKRARHRSSTAPTCGATADRRRRDARVGRRIELPLTPRWLP